MMIGKQLLSAAIAIVLAAGAAYVATGPAYAQAVNPEALEAYDKAMVACHTAMIRADSEVAERMYHGGFAWNKSRDDFFANCLGRHGYRMQGTQAERLAGTPPLPQSHAVSAEQVRRNFEQGMLRYGGPGALDRHEAQMMALRGQSARGTVEPRAMSVGTPAVQAVEQAAPDAPGIVPSDTRRQIFIQPRDDNNGARPIWGIQR